MNLNATGVKTAFGHFSGEEANEAGTEREAACAALCGQCARQVEAMVDPGLSEEELASWEDALEALAAAMAFYQLVLTEEAVTPASLSAGEVKLSAGERSAKAAQLAEEKRRAAAPALAERGFRVESVGWQP